MVCDTGTKGRSVLTIEVLILILLEYGLRLKWINVRLNEEKVLILILLEYGLRLNVRQNEDSQKFAGLNPYSTGIWSATHSLGQRSSERRLS